MHSDPLFSAVRVNNINMMIYHHIYNTVHVQVVQADAINAIPYCGSTKHTYNSHYDIHFMTKINSLISLSMLNFMPASIAICKAER